MTNVSIVVNTCDRAASLAATLTSFRWLDHRDVEIIVVNGPSADATAAVIASHAEGIKIGHCPTRNLSRSRNIGCRLAAGEIVAFIDDDAVADPAWLSHILPLFDDPEIAAAGGPVFDHTGVALQDHYIVCDRFGAATRWATDPSPLLNIPDGATFCSTLGTNSLFRRAALVAIGGFDEEYDYFLDETDVCIRLVDAGWTVRMSQAGHVYHRYLPSQVRNAARVVADYGPVLKNKAYFAMRHGAALHGQAAVQGALDGFVAGVRDQLTEAVAAGQLSHRFADQFETSFDERLRHGIGQAFQPRRSSLDPRHAGPDLPWRPYPGFAGEPSGRLHVCLVSQDYPPGIVAGIARVTHELAAGLAATGHIVRVLTCGDCHTVDFEAGIWVHRLPRTTAAPPTCVANLPATIWGRSVAVLAELGRIAQLRPIDLVQAPNWDCEALATILDGRWPVVLAVYTPMITALRHNPNWQADAALRRAAIDPIIAGERLCYQRAAAILACGPAILASIAADYELDFATRRVGLVPHGQADQGGGTPPPADKATVDILAVGRLEHRKGTDVLLAAVPALFAGLPELRLIFAGDDRLPAGGATTLKADFLADPATAPFHHQVRFLGRVDAATLDQLYRDADIVVMASRFESFGLPLIEAMMRGRPVVASDVGGIAEIVTPETGCLVPPGDPRPLAIALRQLAIAPSRRRAMGARARARYLAHYTADHMVRGVTAFYRELCRPSG